MKTYAVLFKFVPNVVERRKPYRPEHLKHIAALRDAGSIVAAGPFTDNMDGALMVFRADSAAEAEEMVHRDPYYKAGLWPEIVIREWPIVTASESAFAIAITESPERH